MLHSENNIICFKSRTHDGKIIMGAGAGHIFDMIARLKANRALLNKRNYFKNKQEFHYVMHSKKLTYEKCTEADLVEIRKKMLERRKWDMVKSIASLIAAALITIVIGYWFMIVIRKSI